ncbi:MAG: BTAD domain-containing putative transcriptional regulator [Gaiellaceae bacterium]
MEFRILGSFEARHDDGPVDLPGSKPRALLALLLLHPNETLSTDRLADALWGESPPATAPKALQVHVSSLRKALAPAGADAGASLLTREHGYELRLDPERLDAHCFERLLALGRAELDEGLTARAASTLEEALSLWRGQPLSDLAFAPFAQREIARLADLRVGAEEDLIEAKLALGAHENVVGRLETLVEENPHRERLRAQLMLSLYRCERQADALCAYQDARRTLVDELGIEPGERLRELERAILAQDRALSLEGVAPPEQTEPPTVPGGAGSIFGRKRELAEMAVTLAAAGGGLRLLVLEGEPGIGKTTLWRDGLRRAAALGYRVLSCRAAPAETRLSFAGLADLLASVDAAAYAPLPPPQRHALEVALLRTEAGEAGLDPRAIGTGLVSLLSGLTASGPLLLAIDDVQWLDGPTLRTLEFALHRIEAAPVAVVATLRPRETGGSDRLLSAVPAERTMRVRLGPLDADALYEIVREHVGAALTRPLLASIERASRGNPFYALELARALETAGHPAAGETLPVPDDMRELVEARLRRLPHGTREELLKASALAQPTTVQLDRAELVPAEEAHVVSIDSDGRVEFSHPLLAAAIHAAASPARRRMLHADLAELVVDSEERAWHLSLGADRPDEQVASVLDAAADEAHRRGAPDVAAELQERATQLTPEHADEARWKRSLRAARHHLRAGDRDRARVLAAGVACTAPPRVRAHALHLEAEGRAGTSPGENIVLLEEALTLARDDAQHSAELELGLGLALMGMSQPAEAAVHLDRAVELAESAGESGLVAGAIAFREASRLFSGRGVDDAALERALALEDLDRDAQFQLRPSLIVASVYLFTGRIGVAEHLLAGTRERILARGEEGDLAFVLTYLTSVKLLSGKLAAAEDVAAEAMRAAALSRQEIFSAWALAQRAMARASIGATAAARADGAEALAMSERIGWPDGVAQSRWALGFLALSQGDPEGAVAVLEPLVAKVEEIGVFEWPIAGAVPDAIEALLATGGQHRAGRLAARLADWGHRFDRPWALALAGRSHALLHLAAGDVECALTAAEQALVEHERLPMPFERARTLLVLGQAQRGCAEERAAARSLDQACTLFEEMGASGWAAKASQGAPGAGRSRAPSDLTEDELRVARLAATGLTNREIAAQMFISRSIVEANLACACRKLGVQARADLAATIAPPRSSSLG